MAEYPRLPAEKNVDMEAECLFQYVYGANDIFYPHSHEFYEIFLTVSGTVTHYINGIIQPLPEGSLVFIRPDDVHGYRYDNPKSAETAYINLTFTRETAASLFAYLSDSFPSDFLLSCDMPPTILLSKTEKGRLLLQISELNRTNWNDKKELKLRMRALLADIFTRFFSHIPTDTLHPVPSWLSHLVIEMEQPDHFIAGIDRMVALSQRSREHLSRSLKQYYGLTITEYINHLRINYASNLLLHTNTPLIDICFCSGFQSMSYFYRVFKLRQGMSPGVFREHYREASGLD